METLQPSIKSFQSHNDSNSSEFNSKESNVKSLKVSAGSVLSATATRSFDISPDFSIAEKSAPTPISEMKSIPKEKSKKEEKVPREERISKQDKTAKEDRIVLKGKESKKYFGHVSVVEDHQGQKKAADRDIQRIKARYNVSIGKIMREWAGLIYCILILRMNLVQFILLLYPDQGEKNVNFQKQVEFESQTVYNTIKQAQNTSQCVFLYLWAELEKLIVNRTIIRNALQGFQAKEPGLQDWKTAATKLAELQEEVHKCQDQYKLAQKCLVDIENSTNDKVSNLEKLLPSRETEYKLLLEKVTEMKKREVQMKGKILINMKSYKNLKLKRQKLMSMEEERERLKNEQSASLAEYTSTIQTLKSEIEEKEKLIKELKEEKKKIRASLEKFEDYAKKSPGLPVQET